MVLNVIKAEYLKDYIVELTFDNGVTKTVDLESTVRQEKRKIFQPLRDIEYFRKFQIKFNTITWPNEADFAPEFLLELANRQVNSSVAIN